MNSREITKEDKRRYADNAETLAGAWWILVVPACLLVNIWFGYWEITLSAVVVGFVISVMAYSMDKVANQ